MGDSRLEQATVLFGEFSDKAIKGRWFGSLVEATHESKLLKYQFDRALKFLKASGCIEVIAQGNRIRASEVEVIRPPTEEDFLLFGLTAARPSGMLEQRVNDLARQIGGVDLIKTLAEVETRLTRLEQKLDITNEEI